MSSEDPAEAARLLADEANIAAVLHDLELRYIALEKERDELQLKAESLEGQLDVSTTQQTSKDEELRTMESKLASAQRDRQVFEDKCLTVDAERKTQEERMDRMEAEADSLREEISRLTEANSAMTAKLAEADTKKVLSSSVAIPIQYELERVRKELDSLTSHNKWLETELTSKGNQLALCRAEHSKEVIELRTNLDKAVADRDVLTSHEEALSRSCEELQSKVDLLSNQVFQQQQEATDSSLALKDELAAERRLVDLQKEQLERLEQRYNDITKQAEQMKELASQASAESSSEQVRIRNEVMEECQRMLQKQAEDHRRQMQDLEEQLQEANRRRIEAEDGLMASPPSRRRPRALLTAAAGESTETSAQDDEEPLSLTDLYARLTEREEELRVERTERRRLELYQRKILADMKAKAPLFLRQKQEYELAVEKYQESKARLDDALEEMAAARQEASEVRGEMISMGKTARELEQENRDLAKQVQALLRSRAGGEVESVSWNDSAGDDIPVCITIEEIQNQNQRLLREHRRLTDEVAELKEKLQTEPLKLQLEDAQKELSSLRQDRQRQETLVAGIVQQRDLYRALLGKHDSSIISGDGSGSGGEDTTALILAQQEEKSKEIEDRNRQLERDLAKVRADLSASDRAKEGLEDRLARYDAHSSEFTTSVDRLQVQVASANATAARSEADASYHRDKCTRLEEMLHMSRTEASRANDAKREMQSVNAELQQAVAVAKSEAGKYEQELRQASMKSRLTETQLETAKAAETRIALEANSLRSELARQGALLESIQRIEASLSAKNEEDKEKLRENSERISQALAAEQSKHAIEIENHLSSIRELGLEVKSAEEKKDSAVSELVEAKKEALAATTEKQELIAKCSRLEIELRSAKAKLGEEDSEHEGEEITMQTRIETLTTELDAARAELAAVKESVATYKKMAKDSEDALADLNKATEDYKRTQATKTENLNNDLASLQKDADAKQEMIVELTRDLANHRGEQDTIVSQLNVEIENWKEKFQTATKDAEASAARLAAVDADIASYRADSTAAQNNYERELALHASARTALRSARTEAESEVRLRKIAEEQVQSLKAEWAAERKVLEEEKASLQGNMKDTEKSLSESRAQIEVLHSQIATLGDMVEKSRSENIAALSSATTDAAGESSGATASDEVDNLRKLVSELRETVRFMRSERDAIQAQLDASRRSAESERAAFSVTKRSLDEARSELNILQKEKDASGKSAIMSESSALKGKELEDKFKQSEEQLTLLRESNKLLREEAETTEKTLSTVQSELADVKKSVEPAVEKYRQLEIEKAALEAEKASLVREIDAWKGRTQSLVSKFHQIDPDEHEKVKKQVEELTKQCDELKSQKATAEKESSSAKGVLSRLNKELSQQRALVETQRKTISKVTSEKEDVTKSSKAAASLTKERDQLKEEIQKMRSEAASKNTELKGAQQRNEKLMTHLRTFQKKIAEHKAKSKEQTEELAKLKAREKDQEKELAQLKAREIEREKEPKRPTSPAPQKQDQRVAQDSSSFSQGSAQVSQKDENRAIPRVLPGGFKFGPDGVAPASSASNRTSETEPSMSLEPSSKEAKEGRSVTTPPTAAPSGDLLATSSEPSATVEKNQDDSMAETGKLSADPKTKNGPQKRKAPSEEKKGETKRPAPDSTAKSAPQKRKAAPEGKKEELSIREKLMQKKRKLAEKLKKAEQESDKNTEEKAEPPQSEGQSGMLSAEAKPWAPPSKKKELAPVEEPETSIVAPESAPSEEKVYESASAESAANEESHSAAATSQKQKDGTLVLEQKPAESDLEPAGSADIGEEAAPAAAEETVGEATESKEAAVFSGKSPFGGTGFGAPSGIAPISFGSSQSVLAKSAPATSSLGTKPAVEGSTSSFGSSFLDIKPPGSSSAPSFSFGSSGSITLPTPSKALSPATSSFGIFGQQKAASNPFGGGVSSQAKPLFGESTAKPSATEDEEHQETNKGETEEGGHVEDETGDNEEDDISEADV